MVRKTPGDLWGGLMPKEFYDAMWETITMGQCFVGDIQNRRKNGERYWQEVHIIPVLSEDGPPKYFIGIELGVAAPERSQDLIDRYQARVRGNRVQVQWPLEWLFNTSELSEEQLQILHRQFSKEAVDTLADDLILLSHIKFAANEPLEKFRIDALLDELLREVQKEYPDRHFHLETAGTRSIRVLQHRSFLVHIMRRLLQNAAQYSRPGTGQIRVAVSCTPTTCIVSCDDNGIGMTVTEQLKIYRKFFRGAKARRLNPHGVGLSLHIVKAIVDVMDWHLTSTSVPGVGTTFKLSFPVEPISRQKSSARRK
jgi:signal transduction histidine kinase